MRAQRQILRMAFTLTDLVVLLGLAAMVLSFLMPAILTAQGAAGRRETINSLKNIGLALHNAADAFNRFPPAYGNFGKPPDATVHVHILPFIEHSAEHKQYIQANGGDKVQSFKIPEFLSSLDTSRTKDEGVQNFAANLRVFSTVGVKSAYNKNIEFDKKETFDGKLRFPQILDGTANTIVYSTKYAVCGDGGSRYAPNPHSKFAAFFGVNAATEKASPNSAKATFQLAPATKECVCSPLMAQSFEKNGLIVGIADGSVRTLGAGISAENWNRALHPNDGMILEEGWDN